MAAVVGKSGSVSIGANVVAELDEWSLDVDSALLDDTSFGDQWKTYIAGLNGATGSLKGKWDVATDTNGQAAAQAAVLAGTVLTSLKLDVDGTHNYTFNAFLSKIQIDSKVAALVTFQADFTATGAVTYA